MRAKIVEVGKLYVYQPVWLDKYDGRTTLKENDIVRVIESRGCPPANTMGHCYVEKDGKFMGLVCTNSLEDYGD